jgi:hypothetical protein
MYKHSSVGNATYVQENVSWVTITTSPAATSTLNTVAPLIPTSVQTGQDTLNLNLHLDFASPYAINPYECVAVYARMTTPYNVVRQQPFMLEYTGVATSVCSEDEVAIIPVAGRENNAWTLSSQWATGAQTNVTRFLPHSGDPTGTNGRVSSWDRKVIFQNSTGYNDPIFVGVIFANLSTVSRTLYEANITMTARYAIERVATYEREY